MNLVTSEGESPPIMGEILSPAAAAAARRQAVELGHVTAAHRALKKFVRTASDKGRFQDVGLANAVLTGRSFLEGPDDDPFEELAGAAAWVAQLFPQAEPPIYEAILEPCAHSMKDAIARMGGADISEVLSRAVADGIALAQERTRLAAYESAAGAAGNEEGGRSEDTALVSRKQEALATFRALAAVDGPGELRRIDDGLKLALVVNAPLADQAKVALAGLAQDEKVKVFGGDLCELVCDHASDRYSFKKMLAWRVQERLSAVCRGASLDVDGALEYNADIPFSIASAIVSRPSFGPVATAAGVSRTTMVRPSGTVIEAPGYDEETQLWVAPNALCVEVSEFPSDEDVADARAALELPWEEFEFIYPEIDRAVCITPMMTHFAMFMHRGPTPPVIFNASAPGSGKGMAANINALVMDGIPVSGLPISEDEAETAKQLIAIGLRSAPYICFDNVTPGMLAGNSALLNAWAAPNREYVGRLLGHNSMVTVKLNNTWMLTGNNVMMSADSGRRMLFAHITSSVEDPARRVFKRADLPGFVASNRAPLAAACLTILRGYAAAGSPSQGLRPMGGFEEWSRCVRSAMVWAGFADPVRSQDNVRDAGATLMDNLFDGLDAIDPEGRGKTTKEIYASRLMNGHIAEIVGSAKEDQFAKKLGSMKGRIKDSERGRRALYMDRTEKGSTWFLVPVAADARAAWADARGWKEARRERLFTTLKV